ncbi:MAG: BREX-1 system adenine-specific DNA-methyltransferase PglX [Bacteroidales bacterium]
MDTNRIKSFAKEARLILMDGVLQRLKYWGFNIDGTIDQNLQSTKGGYIFRGQVFTDTSVPGKWNKLKKRISNKQDVKDVVEEAAYTWFNRLMAIKILEVNGYISPVLEFTKDIRTPVLVQNAKRGQHNLTKQSDKDLLMEYLQEDKEEQALGLLVTELCNTNNLLHDVFGRIDDYTEILLPQNLLQKDGILELINNGAISNEDFKEVELIGWLYQFYISDKKDEVFAGFKKNKKARAEDIPAATQIFTPKWIVRYMVENTVGKIYLDYEPNSSFKTDLKYLVENESDNEATPIINDIKELTLLDPACGSGHILVVGFELLFKMYREEGYTAKQAVENILQHSIFGLDIDDRAVQLARFAVLLKAGHYDSDILNRKIIPNIYSFPEATLSDSFKEEYYSKEQSDWYQLLGMKLKKQVSLSWFETEIDKKNSTEKEVKKTLTIPKGSRLNHANIDILQLHCIEPILIDYSSDLETFWGDVEKGFSYSEFFYAILLLQQGKNFGSATKLKLSYEALSYIKKQFNVWEERANNYQLDAFKKSLWDNLKPHIEILFILLEKYTTVVANPPYMGEKGMNEDLKNYLSLYYPITCGDLATVFMDVCINLSIHKGIYGMINQASWMLKPAYKEFREYLIKSNKKDFGISSLLYLGAGVFEELKGEVVQSVCFTFINSAIEKSILYKLNGIPGSKQKEFAFLNKNTQPYIKILDDFESFKGKQFGFWLKESLLKSFDETPIRMFGDAKQGIKTGDNPQFIRNWFEVSNKQFNIKWFPVEKGGGFRKWYGNNDYLLDWEDDGYRIKNFKNENGKLRSRPQNLGFFFEEGITWSTSAGSKPSFRMSSSDFTFESSGSKFFITNEETEYDLYHFIAFFNSIVTKYIIEVFAPGIGFSEGSIKLLPFIGINYNEKDLIKEKGVQNTEISKTDWDSKELSWNLKKSPLLNDQDSLSKAYYFWNKKVTDDFFLLHENEEELNRIFISLYGLQDELTPEVSLKDITILQDGLDRNALEELEPIFREKSKDAIELPINKTEILSQFISYTIGVFLGRYRLDKPGLNIAHPKPTEEEIASYQYNRHTIEIDEDGILPIMGIDCAFPDDALVRVKDFILAIWGEESLTDNINFLHECLGMNMNKWLTEKFWNYHTSMYSKKPIYWMFSSNAKKSQNAAFKVLVYMHRMDKYTVQKIQRSYLHPHQEYIKREIEKLLENEENLSRQEQKRLEQLQNWELECRDYNEVLKELANQQIEFDLDDGVAVNYAKFEGAVAII